MTTLTPIAPDPVVLGTSETVLYSVPAGAVLLNGYARFTNVTAGPVSITVYGVPSGGSAGDGNAHAKAYSIGASSYADLNIGNMAAGATLSALASAGASITARLLSGTLRQ